MLKFQAANQKGEKNLPQSLQSRAVSHFQNGDAVREGTCDESVHIEINPNICHNYAVFV